MQNDEKTCKNKERHLKDSIAETKGNFCSSYDEKSLPKKKKPGWKFF